MSNESKHIKCALTVLPEKLSDIIDVALNDLEACEKDRRYVIDMRDWHRPFFEGNKALCAVCLAGVVMAQSLKKPVSVYQQPKDVDVRSASILYALNEVRCGNVIGALLYFEDTFKGSDLAMKNKVDLSIDYFGSESRDVPDYSESPSKFKAAIREIAIELRKLGV